MFLQINVPRTTKNNLVTTAPWVFVWSRNKPLTLLAKGCSSSSAFCTEWFSTLRQLSRLPAPRLGSMNERCGVVQHSCLLVQVTLSTRWPVPATLGTGRYHIPLGESIKLFYSSLYHSCCPYFRNMCNINLPTIIRSLSCLPWCSVGNGQWPWNDTGQ